MGIAVTVWAARIIPPLLLGIIGYVSWIITITVAQRHFLEHGRRSAGIAILVIYWLLFVLVLSSFLRMLFTTATNPGYLDKGPPVSSDIVSDRPAEWTKDDRNPSLRSSFAAPQLSDFYSKEVFVCTEDGMPRWCHTCRIWKPDRSRHCREKDRCVLKQDHFCPWVGGIVSEMNFKFFIQFNTYTVLYTICDWVVAAICIADARSDGGSVNGHWIAMLIMGLFFMGLTGGIGCSAWICAVMNHSTPENVAAPAGHRWTLALRMPAGAVPREGVPTITFPALPKADQETLQAYLKSSVNALDSDDSSTIEEHERGPTFAIVQSDPYMNPWDLGRLANWQQVMGRWPWDWLLPTHYGGTHFSHRTYGDVDAEKPPVSFFPTSVDVEVLKARIGLKVLSGEEQRCFAQRLERRKRFPYLLGGAGAPKKQWATSLKHHKDRKQELKDRRGRADV